MGPSMGLSSATAGSRMDRVGFITHQGRKSSSSTKTNCGAEEIMKILE